MINRTLTYNMLCYTVHPSHQSLPSYYKLNSFLYSPILFARDQAKERYLKNLKFCSYHKPKVIITHETASLCHVS